MLTTFGMSNGVLAQDEAPEADRLSTDLGVAVTTDYFFRGAIQEDTGLILQPSMEVGMDVSPAADGSFTTYAGIWNSVHSEQTGERLTSDGPDALYEQDLYGGVTYSPHEKWTLGASYVVYTSPNDAFDTIQELDVSVAFDDSQLLGKYALSPELTVARELDNTLLGSDEGTWLGLSFAPETEISADEAYPVTMSIPFGAGFSLEDYYVDSGGDDHAFGYAKAGALFEMPLSESSEYGNYTAYAGVDVLYLGTTNEELNSDDELDVVGTIGVNLSY